MCIGEISPSDVSPGNSADFPEPAEEFRHTWNALVGNDYHLRHGSCKSIDLTAQA
jgi:hypothetical protein